MDIEKLTVEQVKEIISLLKNKETEYHPYLIGEKYFIRTVTLYYLGRLKWVGPLELVITGASWVADTGKFSEFIKGNLQSDAIEIEPILKDVILGRGALVDVIPWEADLPTKVQ